MKTLLSFDASTSTIGISILQFDENTNPKVKPEIELLHLEYYKPLENNLFQSLSEVRSKVAELIKKWKPNFCALEDIIFFMQNKSSAASTLKLSALNRTVGTAIFDFHGTSPILLAPISIRHQLKTNKILPKKEELPIILEKRLNFAFPWEYKKTGKPKDENFDMSDSLALGVAVIEKKIAGTLIKKIKPKKTKSKKTKKKIKK